MPCCSLCLTLCSFSARYYFKTGFAKKILLFQGKGKKRAVGWFPASYVKLLAGNEAPAPASGAADASAPAATNGAGKSREDND